MKLKNRKTGEIVEVESCNSTTGTIGLFFAEGRECDRAYNTLAELNEEWEDVPEEPKKYWAIDSVGGVFAVSERALATAIEGASEIGNYFGTKEEAEQAVEKLEAWKRLKDKGFKFGRWQFLDDRSGIWVRGNLVPGIVDELDIIFGGEE